LSVTNQMRYLIYQSHLRIKSKGEWVKVVESGGMCYYVCIYEYMYW